MLTITFLQKWIKDVSALVAKDRLKTILFKILAFKLLV